MMIYIIEDYNFEKHKKIDDWIDEKQFPNAKIINQYATFGEPISDYSKYLINNPKDMANIKSFIKVFSSIADIVGVIVFHYYVDDGIYFLAINPIIINPNLLNKGFGKDILKYIIKNINIIVDSRVDYLVSQIEKNNIVSLRLFESLGFIKEQENKNFIEYKYTLPL